MTSFAIVIIEHHKTVCNIMLKTFRTFVYSSKEQINFDNFTAGHLCWKTISCEVMTPTKGDGDHVLRA